MGLSSMPSLEVTDLSDKIRRAVKGIRPIPDAQNRGRHFGLVAAAVMLAGYHRMRRKAYRRMAFKRCESAVRRSVANIGLPPMLHCAKARPFPTLEPLKVCLIKAALAPVG